MLNLFSVVTKMCVSVSYYLHCFTFFSVSLTFQEHVTTESSMTLTSAVFRAIPFYRLHRTGSDNLFIFRSGGEKREYYLAIYRGTRELHELWGRAGRNGIWWTHAELKPAQVSNASSSVAQHTARSCNYTRGVDFADRQVWQWQPRLRCSRGNPWLWQR